MANQNKGFRLVRQGELVYLQSSLLEECGVVDHAFSTRLGGCSSGAMLALNTAFHTGDSRECVLENRRRLLSGWGYDLKELVAGIQVHGTGVALVTEKDRGRGAAPGTFLGEYDALVTAAPGVVLTAYAADCFLLYFVEPRLPVIALAHAGWRGTLGGMARLVVEYLREQFAVEPGGLSAAVSPGVCSRCYPVDGAVAERFRDAGWGGEPYLEPAPGNRYHLDLSRINAAQLRRAGVREERLAAGHGWCTACRPDLFYSYRRERGVTGRMIGFLAIRPGGKEENLS